MVRLFGLSSDDLDDPVPSVQAQASMNTIHQSPSFDDEATLEDVKSELNGIGLPLIRACLLASIFSKKNLTNNVYLR